MLAIPSGMSRRLRHWRRIISASPSASSHPVICRSVVQVPDDALYAAKGQGDIYKLTPN